MVISLKKITLFFNFSNIINVFYHITYIIQSSTKKYMIKYLIKLVYIYILIYMLFIYFNGIIPYYYYYYYFQNYIILSEI